MTASGGVHTEQKANVCTYVFPGTFKGRGIKIMSSIKIMTDRTHDKAHGEMEILMSNIGKMGKCFSLRSSKAKNLYMKYM